eukprot:gb/GEZN01017465.1/.p1 GENE.gb/GEZN01017465.1/~~gb/GEZN01017465.1/.p1  ORF type:complete len:110 (-),score=9.11 gb/GEZN01017465.1/:4-333(-)
MQLKLGEDVPWSKLLCAWAEASPEIYHSKIALKTSRVHIEHLRILLPWMAQGIIRPSHLGSGHFLTGISLLRGGAAAIFCVEAKSSADGKNSSRSWSFPLAKCFQKKQL